MLIRTLACPPPPIDILFRQVHAAGDIQGSLEERLGLFDAVAEAGAIGFLQMVQIPDGPGLNPTMRQPGHETFAILTV